MLAGALVAVPARSEGSLPVAPQTAAGPVAATSDALLEDQALAELLAATVPSVWTTGGSVRAGFGYRDNVLLSTVNPVAAALVTAGGDFLLTRPPTDGTEVALLASADGTYFVDEPRAEPEAMALFQGEVKRDLGHDWRAGLRGQYVFLHQVFDVSATEADLSTVTARGHTLLAGTSAGRALGRGWRAAAVLEGSRQLLDEPLDNYWESTPMARVTWEHGRRAEVTGQYRFGRRWYDDRAALDADGNSLPERLRFDSHEVELRPRVFWDQGRHWSTQLRLGVLDNSDNGGGYFDYWRYGAGLQVRYRTDRWSLRAELRGRWYDYEVQTSGGTGTALRDKADVSVVARADCRLGRGWTLYAQYDHETADDTLPDSNYRANTVVAGVEWEP